MSRVASVLGSIGRSATRLGPLDLAFAGMDYAQGKQDGEDDIRAAAGAAGSTAGGWGGALAGAAAGAALGPVGMGLGAIAGGMGGSFLGGWGADRADEFVRGDQDRNSDLVGPAALAGAGLGTYKLGKAMNFNNYDEMYSLGRGIRRAAPAAGIIGAGVVANNMMGNPIGQGIDMATGAMTGGRGTNFAPDTRSMAGRDTDIPDPYERLVRQTGFANQREAMDYQNQMGQQNAQLAYDRKFDYDDYMTRVKINADQASQLINSYNAGMQNATQAAASILNTRWI